MSVVNSAMEELRYPELTVTEALQHTQSVPGRYAIHATP